MPYYIGDPKRDPNLENCAYRVEGLGFRGSGVSAFIDLLSTRLTGLSGVLLIRFRAVFCVPQNPEKVAQLDRRDLSWPAQTRTDGPPQK